MKQTSTFRLFAFALIFSITLGFSAVKTWTGATNNSWTNGSNWSPSGNPAAGDNIVLNGAGIQPTTNISGTIKSLKLNGANLTLNGSLTITGSVTFNAGIINTTATNILIFNSAATTSGANNLSHVNGPVRKVGNNNAFTFPTGNGTFYASIGISSLSNGGASDYLTAQYFYGTAPYSLTSKDASLINVSNLEYWDLTLTGSNGLGAVVTLSNNSARSGSISSMSDLRVARWNGTQWKNSGGNTTGTPASGTVSTSAGITSFGPFTLTSISSLSPLPVLLISFNAGVVNNSVNLTWSTASEINSDFFTVEKFINSKWMPIATVKGAGNSNTLLNYKTTDNSIAAGEQYYRLKQTNFDGTFIYSDIKKVTLKIIKKIEIVLFPNPAKDFVTFNLINNESGSASVKLINMQGQVILEENNISGQNMTIDISNQSTGIYFIEIIQDGISSRTKLVKE